MLIMSIGKLVNLLENRKVEQKTNKLLILSVELILLYTSQHKGKNLLKKCLSIFIKKSQNNEGNYIFPQNRTDELSEGF